MDGWHIAMVYERMLRSNLLKKAEKAGESEERMEMTCWVPDRGDRNGRKV